MQDLADPEPVSGLHYDQLCEERRDAQLEEEDRILYVACTRAEQRLLLSGTVAFERWPAPRPSSPPIAWLAPALLPDAPKLAESAALSSFPLQIATGEELPVRLVINPPAGAEQDSSAGSSSGRDLSEPGAGPSPSVGLAAGSRSTKQALSAGQDGSPLVDPDGTMSYTSLSELERCGYRYYLERVLRFPENRAAARAEHRGGAVEARARGTIVHALLEAVDFRRPQMPSAEEVGRVARRVGIRLDPAGREEISGLIASALAAPPARVLAAAANARREHPFGFSLAPDQPLVSGVFDLIVTQPDGVELIVDYKSDRLTGAEDLELLVQSEYGFQRLLYALAAIEGGAGEVEVAHWFLERPEEWHGMRFLASEREELRARLFERVEAVRASGFSVTEDPHREICLTCPGRGGLCSWGESRTLRAHSAPLEFQE